MRRLVVIPGVVLCISIGVFLSADEGSKETQEKTFERQAWVEKCLRDFEAIKPGMTRKEVQAQLHSDGGLQGVSPVRFVHPECPYFKIDVEFSFGRDEADQGRALRSDEDPVVRVSKP
jgi:hypothetical protein